MSRSFNGSTDRLDWAAIADLTDDPITISAWIYSDGFAGNADYIFEMHASGNTANGVQMYLASTLVIGYSHSGTTSLYRGSAADSDLTGAWHHVLVTHTGANDYTTIHLYIDGVDKSINTSATNGATLNTQTGSWSIGGRIFDDNRNLDGKIAEVGVWNAVLDSTTIAALASGDVPSAFPTNLLFYYAAKADTTTAETGGAAATVDGTAYSSDHPLMDYFSSLAGAITPAGTIVNAGRKILAGAITPAGALVNAARKVLAGAITPAGPAAWIRDVFTSQAGAITPAGTVTKAGRKPLAGELTSAGALVKAAWKVLAGALTSEGLLSAFKNAGATVYYSVLVGALTPAGEVVRSGRKVLSGALAPAGDVLKRALKLMEGYITPAGTVSKQIRKILAGALDSAGDLATSFIGGAGTLYTQTVAGALTMAGVIATRTNKILTGVLTPAGSITKRITKAFVGALSFTGDLIERLVSTIISIPGSVVGSDALIQLVVGGDALRGDVAGADGHLLTLDYTQKVLLYVPPTAYWDLNDLTGLVAKNLMAGYDGTYYGVSLGQTGMGDGKTSVYFDNDNDYMHFYSSGFAGVFNGNLFSFSCWMKTYNSGVWTDGAIHDWMFCRVDANNNFFVRKSATNNQLTFSRTAAGTLKQWSTDVTSYIPDLSGWFHLAVVCNQASDIWKGYINGVDVTPVFSGNLSWSGTLDSNYSLLGGSIANPAIEIHEWYGWMQHFMYFNRALSSSEVLMLATE